MLKSFEAPRFAIVFGALRSGTTMLRLMLNAHSQLSCPGETDFLFDHMSRNASGAYVYDSDALKRDRIFQMAEVAFPETMRGFDATDDLIAKMIAPGKLGVLMLHRGLETALAMAPQVKIIHLVRDPRDVANSSIGMGWAGNVYYGVDHWIETEKAWAALKDSLDPDQVLTVHFEALAAAPETELARICAFLGQRFEPEMLRYAETSTYAKPDAALANQWRARLTPFDLGLIEAKIGPLLSQLEYDPSGFPLIVPSGVALLALSIQNRRKIWGLLFKQFGVIDPILIGLSRRLKLPRLGYAPQARVNAKTMKLLK